MIINKSGKFYFIYRNNTETTDQLIKRSWFLVNNLHLENNEIKTIQKFKEEEKNSRLWFNIRILGCQYSQELEKKILEIEDKVFV